MWKKYLINKRIENNLKKKNTLELPLRSGIIIFPSETSIDKNFIRKLSHITSIPYDKWDVLFLSNDEPHPDFVSVLDAHFNWRGKLIEPNIQKYFNKNYDLLIDFSSLKNTKERLVSSGIQAGFRIGTTPDQMQFYDLVIQEQKDLPTFLHELKKYLYALGYIKPADVL